MTLSNTTEASPTACFLSMRLEVFFLYNWGEFWNNQKAKNKNSLHSWISAKFHELEEEEVKKPQDRISFSFAKKQETLEKPPSNLFLCKNKSVAAIDPNYPIALKRGKNNDKISFPPLLLPLLPSLKGFKRVNKQAIWGRRIFFLLSGFTFSQRRRHAPSP